MHRVVKAIRSRLIYITPTVLLGLVLALNSFIPDAPQYRELAESFLRGKLYFLDMPSGWGDTSLYAGRYYWPLGPFPAVTLMPFAWSGIYHQGLISFAWVLTIFYLCFRLAAKLGYSRADSCLLATAFCFGTSFLAQAAVPLAWNYAHVVAVAMLFFALNEYVGKRRSWLIGLLVGLATASRPLTLLSSIFFIGAIGLAKSPLEHRVIKLAMLGLSLAVILSALGWYNAARFGVPWETGYAYQISYKGIPVTTGALFDLAYIDDHLGQAFKTFLISPFLLCLFLGKRYEAEDWLLLAAIVATSMAALSFRSDGGPNQLGYRFSTDYLPLAFLFLMRRQAALGNRCKLLMAGSVIITVCMFGYLVATRSA